MNAAVEPQKLGTINAVVLASAALAQPARVELITVATEARAALLQELNIVSPLSGGLATGTDAIAIVCGAAEASAEPPIRFAGKHTILGERVALLMMAAIRESPGCYEQGVNCGQGVAVASY